MSWRRLSQSLSTIKVFRGGRVRLRVLKEKGYMAAKKMFPPRAVENLLGDDYDEFKLGISFRIQAGQVVMQFSDHAQRIRMSSAGAQSAAQ